MFTSSRAGGALAVLVLLVFLIGGGLVVGQSAVDARKLEADAVSSERDVLQKRLQMPAQSAARLAGTGNPYVEAANLALAANALQQRVTRLVEDAGGTMQSIGTDPPDANDDIAGRRVVVQASFEIENDGLQEALYALESANPVVLVDTLDVRLAPSAVQASLAGKAADTSPRLTVNLRAVGYYRRAAR
jgi:hypothetical protein